MQSEPAARPDWLPRPRHCFLEPRAGGVSMVDFRRVVDATGR